MEGMSPEALRDVGVDVAASHRVVSAWKTRLRYAKLDVLAAPSSGTTSTSMHHSSMTASSSTFVSPHQGSVMDIRVDPSREFVLSCSLDGTVVISQATMSGQLQTLACVQRESVGAHRRGVQAVCWYTHDNGMFLSGARDKTVKVWDSNALEAVLTFHMSGAVYETQMSPLQSSAHNLVAIAGDMNHVTLGDIGTGTATHILGGGGGMSQVWTCAWSVRSEWELISGASDGQVRLWDIRRPGTQWVFDSNDGFNDFSVGGAHERRRRNTPRGFIEHAQAHESTVTGCASVPGVGLYWLTTGNDGRPRLWDMNSKCNMMRHYQKRCSKTKYVRRVGFSEDGRFMFHPSENAVYVFDLLSGGLVRTIGGGHFGAVHCAAWNEKYEQLYTGGSDKTMLVWGVPFGALDDQDAWSEDEYR
jgi:WD40 repeat protein